MPRISAPPYTVQIFFQDQDGSGWSEFWWWHADTYQSALDDWRPNTLGSMYDLRKALFTQKVKGTYIRVSDSTVKRDTLVIGVSEADGKGTYDPDVGDSLPADDAALLRLQGTIADRPVFVLKPIRGLPEECVTDGVWTPTIAWSTAFDAFIASLTGKGRIVLKTGDTVTETAIDSATILHMSQRKTGRPFGQSRGRSVRP